MFEHIKNIAKAVFESHIFSFEEVEDKFRYTAFRIDSEFRRTDEQILSWFEDEDDDKFDLNSLKEELESIFITLNHKGIKVLIEELREILKNSSEYYLFDGIMYGILRGKKIKKTKEEEKGLLLLNPYWDLPLYEGAELDFDLDGFTDRISAAFLVYYSEVIVLLEKIEKEYLSSSPTKEDEILVLKPTIWGMSLNINKLWKKFLNSRRR